MYAPTITPTGLVYGFVAGQSCTLNQFFIMFNLILCIIITVLCVHPAVQEANPRSRLAQVSMVALYCTYLIMSAIGNHTHTHNMQPAREIRRCGNGYRVLGDLFTFIAIAYSTTSGATQGRALLGKDRKSGITLAGEDDLGANPIFTTQPSKKDTPRYQTHVAAVEAGPIPASALNEMDDDEENEVVGEEWDGGQTGTRYNVRLYSLYILAIFTDDPRSICGSISSLPCL
jgi:hypothetical protein